MPKPYRSTVTLSRTIFLTRLHDRIPPRDRSRSAPRRHGSIPRRNCPPGRNPTHDHSTNRNTPDEEEIAEALGIAVTVNAGAAIVYSTRTLDAFAAAAEG
jgi:hypothetical protein